MNERIKEIENKCYVLVEGDRIDYDTDTFEDRAIFDKEKFAELIVQECVLMVDRAVKVELDPVACLKEHFGVI